PAARIELLHALVVAIGHVEVSSRVDRDVRGMIHLAARAAELPEALRESSVALEHLHAVVERVGDVDLRRVDRDAERTSQLARSRAAFADRAQRLARAIEHLHAV